MFTGQGFKTTKSPEEVIAQASSNRELESKGDPTDFAPAPGAIKPSRVVSLRSVEIPELVQHLNGFQNIRFQAEEGVSTQRSLGEPFVDVALRVRSVIGDFLLHGVSEKEYYGLLQAARPPKPEHPSSSVLVEELEKLETYLEYRLVSPLGSPFLQEAIPHVHEQLGELMRTIRAAWDGESISPSMTEAVAYQLLDFRAVVTSTALENEAREIGERFEKSLQIQRTGEEGDSPILMIHDQSSLMTEILRQKELQSVHLPSIQNAASLVVNKLIPFIGDLRRQEPAPFGFSFTASNARDPLLVHDLVEVLEEGIHILEHEFSSLHQSSPTDVNYRAYVHGIGHHMETLRIALLRQHAEGSINQHDIPRVQVQCEETLRKISLTMKQLTEVATADLQAMIVGDPEEAA